MIRHIWMSLGFVALATAVLTGCKGLGDISGSGTPPPATPTPSASPTISPAACNPISTNSGLVVVAMGGQVAAVSTAAPYNSIAGYSVGNGAGTYNYSATLINSTFAGAPITTNNVLQFVNIDTLLVYHSAVGFSGTSFPRQPYVFPSPAASPTSKGIGNGFWSTGLVPPETTGVLCYSQVFTLKKGTYFFGDLLFYNTATSYRDALIVESP